MDTFRSFYPATVQLSTSNLAKAALGNAAFASTLCLYRMTIKVSDEHFGSFDPGKLFKDRLPQVFLGNLREVELERINERLSSAIMETCLALTIFREEFKMSFVAMFAILAFIKVFHWLVQDRVDYIEVTPTVSRLQHIRIVSFMFLLLVMDGLFLQIAVSSTLQSGGQSVQLLFAFEYVIQLTTVVSTFLKYTLSMVDSWMEGRWEAKGTYVFYLELVTDMVHLFVYCIFFFIVFTHYGLPLHLVRDLYMTFRNFRNRIADFLRFRQVTARMDRFPDATPADLERCDGICIICREEMSANGTNKKLPCGHVFHVHCLRSWLERQQNCPTCRANVFRPRQVEGAADAQGAEAAADGAAAPVAEAQAQDRQMPGQAPGQPPMALPQQHPMAGAAGMPPPPTRFGSGVPAGAGPPGSRQPRRGVHPGPPPCPPPFAAPQAALPPGAPGPPGYWAQPLPAGLVWQLPGQWYPMTSMAAFPTPMQYAGQQTAESSQGNMAGPMQIPGLTGLQGLVPALLPLPVIPTLSAPFPMFSAPLPMGATAEQQHAHTQAAVAAIMAAAAATAVYTPFAGLVMMPPAMLAPTVAPHEAATGAVLPGQSPAAAAQGHLAAAAAALMGGDHTSFQASIEATQRALLNQLELLQAHVDRLRRPPGEATAAAAPGPGVPPAASAPIAVAPVASAPSPPSTAASSEASTSTAGSVPSAASTPKPATAAAAESSSHEGAAAPEAKDEDPAKAELRRRRLARFAEGSS